MSWVCLAAAFASFLLGTMFTEDLLGLGTDYPERYLLPFGTWMACLILRALWGACARAGRLWGACARAGRSCQTRGNWWYAVRRGRQAGVYNCWEGPHGAKQQVQGFSGAMHCKFRSRRKALAWVAGNSEAYPPLSARSSAS